MSANVGKHTTGIKGRSRKYTSPQNTAFPYHPTTLASLNLIMSAATLTAVAVFENPRKLERGKTIVIDAQIYMGAHPPLIAALRYFNVNDISFEDIGTYFMHATVSTGIYTFTIF